LVSSRAVERAFQIRKDIAMRMILRTLPILASILAAPAYAGGQDPHAGHHPAEAVPAARAAVPKAAEAPPGGCPMLSGAMSGASMGGHAPPAPSGDKSASPKPKSMPKPADGSMSRRAMMMAPGDRPCMPSATPPSAPDAHEHPAPKPGG